MSAMRSASSMTTTSTSSRSTSPCRTRSARRPGHATSDVDAAAQRLALRARSRRRRRRRRPRTVAAAAERRELARDLGGELAGRHEHEAAWAAGLRALATRATSGMPNASVLPEPVGALPQTSRPARASGMVAAWMGKGW